MELQIQKLPNLILNKLISCHIIYLHGIVNLSGQNFSRRSSAKNWTNNVTLNGLPYMASIVYTVLQYGAVNPH